MLPQVALDRVLIVSSSFSGALIYSQVFFDVIWYVLVESLLISIP